MRRFCPSYSSKRDATNKPQAPELFASKGKCKAAVNGGTANNKPSTGKSRVRLTMKRILGVLELVDRKIAYADITRRFGGAEQTVKKR